MFCRMTLTFLKPSSWVRYNWEGWISEGKHPHLDIKSSVHTFSMISYLYCFFCYYNKIIEGESFTKKAVIWFKVLEAEKPTVKELKSDSYWEGLLLPHHLSRRSQHTSQFSFPFIFFIVYHIDFIYFILFLCNRILVYRPGLNINVTPASYLQGRDYKSVPLGSYKVINAILRLYAHDFM